MGMNTFYDVWSQGAAFAANPLVKAPHDILINSTAKFVSPPYKIVDESIQDVTGAITGASLGKTFFHRNIKDSYIYTTPRNWVVNKIAARATEKLQDRVDKSLRVGFKSLFSDAIYQCSPIALRFNIAAGMAGIHGARIVGNALTEAGTKAITEAPQLIANLQSTTAGYYNSLQSYLGEYGNSLAETSVWQWSAWGVRGLANGIYDSASYIASTSPAQVVISKTCDVWDGMTLCAYGAQEALSDAAYCAGAAVTDTSAAHAVSSAGSIILSAAQTIYNNAPDENHGLNASGYIGEVAANAVVNVLNKQDPITKRSTLDNIIENAARNELTNKVDNLFATVFGVASVFAIDAAVTCGQSIIMSQIDTNLPTGALQMAMLGLVYAGDIYKFAKGSASLVSMVLPKVAYLGYKLSGNLPDEIKSKIPGQKVFASIEHEEKVRSWTSYINNGYVKVLGSDALTKAVGAAITEAVPGYIPLEMVVGRPSDVLRTGAIELAVRRNLAAA